MVYEEDVVKTYYLKNVALYNGVAIYLFFSLKYIFTFLKSQREGKNIDVNTRRKLARINFLNSM